MNDLTTCLWIRQRDMKRRVAMNVLIRHSLRERCNQGLDNLQGRICPARNVKWSLPMIVDIHSLIRVCLYQLKDGLRVLTLTCIV
jgi:hypothetical protein